MLEMIWERRKDELGNGKRERQTKTNPIDDDGERTGGVEAAEGVRSSRGVRLEVLDDLRRKIQRVLRLFLPLGSVDPRRSPLLVFVRLAVGREAAVVVALVDGTGAADVGGDVCDRGG
jgi:hypothetical protein